MKIEELESTEFPHFDFADPLKSSSVKFDDILLTEVVNSNSFKRLEKIRFLGGIDYLLVKFPNGMSGRTRYTRHQHSLGVARLALTYSREVGLSDEERRLVTLAALLHDIGHAPFSHSLESVFKDFFGINHHIATANIITGQEESRKDIYEILQSFGVDIEKLLAIISGQVHESYGAFFSAPINFDTIEGILRSGAFNRKETIMLRPEQVTSAALHRSDVADQEIVDRFWEHKDFIYRYLIQSPSGIVADHICKLFMLKNIDRFSSKDYFSTEEKVSRKLPGLLSLLRSKTFETDKMKYVAGPIAFKARRFFVDYGVNFFGRKDKSRYLQERRDSVLVPTGNSDEFQQSEERDFFRDGRN